MVECCNTPDVKPSLFWQCINFGLHPIPWVYHGWLLLVAFVLLFVALLCHFLLCIAFVIHVCIVIISSAAFVLLVMLHFIMLIMCIVCFMHDHPLHHPSPPSLASIWQVPFFTPPLMFISPSQFKHHATHLPAKFHLFWSWFGWDKKMLQVGT